MPTHHNSNSHHDYPRHEPRGESSHRPTFEHGELSLPSIKQAVPEVLIPVDPDAARRRESSATSPGGRGFGLATPPEYVHSPSQTKRPRSSEGGERDFERASRVPRLYETAQQTDYQQQPSPTRSVVASETWSNTNGNGHYGTSSSSSSLRPLAANGGHERADQRPTLPSLPFPPFVERDAVEAHKMRGYSGGDYHREHMGLQHSTSYRIEPGASAYTPTDPGYDYHHPTRNHSLSVGSGHPFDRTPFSSVPYGTPYHDPYLPVRMGQMGIGAPVDNRQRRRRGNLPKETTDKLRSWFQSHLSHPYPTEDEKQDLVRQTGLQLNQISNWFINARRRQLPALQRNARAESYAISNRNGNGNSVLNSPEGNRSFDGRRDAANLSDEEANNYDDGDLERLERHRPANNKRGSI